MLNIYNGEQKLSTYSILGIPATWHMNRALQQFDLILQVLEGLLVGVHTVGIPGISGIICLSLHSKL